MWGVALGVVKWFFGTVVGFLNTKVEADKQIAITSITSQAAVGGEVVKAGMNADNLNAQIRVKEGAYSPIAIITALFLLLFFFHAAQVVLDSCRWLPVIQVWYGIPYIAFVDHVRGSWDVKALPSPFDATEHAAILSLFIGATTAATGLAIIRAVRR